MSKHTPGPWMVFPKESKTRIYCDDTLGSLVADCHTSKWFCILPKSQTEANARLIAASPEMYDLLHEILSNEGMNADTLGKINNLLNKIEQ
jgi:hypothetical protein